MSNQNNTMNSSQGASASGQILTTTNNVNLVGTINANSKSVYGSLSAGGVGWKTYVDPQAKMSEDLQTLLEFVKDMRDRLHILEANHKKMEKFPALEEAYRHYKLIEKLCDESDIQE